MRNFLLTLFLAFMVSACSGCSTISRSGNRGIDNLDAVGDARRATVQIGMTMLVENIRGVQSIHSGLATGWFLMSKGEFSTVVTAGHVCEAPGAIIQGHKIIQIVYTISTYDGEAFLGTVLYDHDESSDDTCVMGVVGAKPKHHMTLSKIPTKQRMIGTPIWYVGYPNGTLGVFEGHVTAQMEGSGYLLGSIETWMGASGSALLDSNGETLGLLSMVDGEFHHHAYFVPVEHLWAAQVAAKAWLEKDHE